MISWLDAVGIGMILRSDVYGSPDGSSVPPQRDVAVGLLEGLHQGLVGAGALVHDVGAEGVQFLGEAIEVFIRWHRFSLRTSPTRRCVYPTKRPNDDIRLCPQETQVIASMRRCAVGRARHHTAGGLKVDLGAGVVG